MLGQSSQSSHRTGNIPCSHQLEWINFVKHGHWVEFSEEYCFCVIVSSGCHNKYHRMGGLMTEVNFSQFWRLQVQDQGSARFGFWWEVSSWLADGYLLAVASHDRSLVFEYWEKSLSFPLLIRPPILLD